MTLSEDTRAKIVEAMARVNIGPRADPSGVELKRAASALDAAMPLIVGELLGVVEAFISEYIDQQFPPTPGCSWGHREGFCLLTYVHAVIPHLAGEVEP